MRCVLPLSPSFSLTLCLPPHGPRSLLKKSNRRRTREDESERERRRRRRRRLERTAAEKQRETENKEEGSVFSCSFEQAVARTNERQSGERTNESERETKRTPSSKKPMTEPKHALDVLPEVLWRIIENHVHPYDRIAFGFTCKTFYEAVTRMDGGGG